jgi:hypothetical protein
MLTIIIFTIIIGSANGQYCCANTTNNIQTQTESLLTAGTYYGLLKLQGFSSYDSPLEYETSMSVIQVPSSAPEVDTKPEKLSLDWVSDIKVGLAAVDYKFKTYVTYTTGGTSSSNSGTQEFSVQNYDVNFYDNYGPEGSVRVPSWDSTEGGIYQAMILETLSSNSVAATIRMYKPVGTGVMERNGMGEMGNYSCQSGEIALPTEIEIVVNTPPGGSGQKIWIIALAGVARLASGNEMQVYTNIMGRVMRSSDGLSIDVGGRHFFQSIPSYPQIFIERIPICINRKDISLRRLMDWAITTQDATTAEMSDFLFPASRFLSASYGTSKNSRQPTPQATTETNALGSVPYKALSPSNYLPELYERTILRGYVCHVSSVTPIMAFDIIVDNQQVSRTISTNLFQLQYYETIMDRKYYDIIGRKVMKNINLNTIWDSDNGATGIYVIFEWDTGCVNPDGGSNSFNPFLPQNILTLNIEVSYILKL